jgi:hypothetical protein
VSQRSASSSTRNKDLIVVCPNGKIVIGGGAQILRNDGGAWEDVALIGSFPSEVNQWKGAAAEGVETPLNWQLEVFAICARVIP